MLDWLFAPSCPVDPPVKAWIEGRMQWLTEEFGTGHLRGAEVILPTPEYFPDSYDGSRRATRRLLERVCRYMGLDPDRVKLSFYRERRPAFFEGSHEGTAGLYVEGTVWVEESNLDDPLRLVGTMAHELGHVHLLGDGRVSPDEEDHEPLTDLLTVFLGMGIFTANSVLSESYWQEGQVAGWNMSRTGYLTMDMYGYAFALFAWYRGEEQPAWAEHLRGDVHAAFKKGLRYLTKTGDSTFRPPQGAVGPQ